MMKWSSASSILQTSSARRSTSRLKKTASIMVCVWANNYVRHASCLMMMIMFYPVCIMLQVAQLLLNEEIVRVVRGCINPVGTGFGGHVMGCILGLRVSPTHRSYDALRGSPTFLKLIQVVAGIAFSVWGLGPPIFMGRIIFFQVLCLALPMHYVTVSKLLNKLEREGESEHSAQDD
ncbi:uncharacterized protein LOC126790100 isoform X1 [Argentina anserina]|uniref:uncharacterized protein LOC126790100 isoform X1 n=1 Tax=Argentina anserina TaxID=57926 RepID=UPI0021766DA6|nr:uncharacterized protein LOC126790100 isoform X1 [Potentilla anserina]